MKCVCMCVTVHVCMWVQGWTTHSKHIKAIPFTLCTLNSELGPTQSFLSLVSLCLLLLFNTATNHLLKIFPWQMETEASICRQQLPPLQIFWHMWSLDLDEEVASFHTLQERPLAQSQRWKISKP